MRFLSATLLFLLYYQAFSQSMPASLFLYHGVSVEKTDGTPYITPWTEGINSGLFSQIDANLDGIKDIYIYDKSSRSSSIFTAHYENNTLVYRYSLGLSKQFPKLEDWVLLRDFDNDGHADIFTRNHISYNGNIILKNLSESTGKMSFEPASTDVGKRGIITKYGSIKTPIYISHIDLPAIDDMDSDGDMDILSFGIANNKITYYKNLSIEKYGVPDSVNEVYEVRNECWGYFAENTSNSSLILNDTCNQKLVASPESSKVPTKHSGSTITALNINGSEAKSLLIGDVGFNRISLAVNGDISSDKTQSHISSKDSLFPINHGGSAPILINNFPAAYTLDIDLDGINDLIVSPYCQSDCENQSSVSYYKNNGSNLSPNYQYITNEFLQEQLIDLGEITHPRFFDYNNDGLMDIVSGNHGVFDSSLTPMFRSSLHLFKNIGSLKQPKFRLIDTDYLNLSSMILDTSNNRSALGLCPAFSDIDNDGDVDLFIGDFNGNVHFFRNSSSPNDTINRFVLEYLNIIQLKKQNNASPFVYDLNQDGIKDLVIGTSSGFIHYYRGTSGSPNTFLAFVNITDSLGRISSKDNFYFNGNSTPYIYQDNNQTILLTGSSRGSILKCSPFDLNNLSSQKLTIQDSTVFGIHHPRTSFDFFDIDNDNTLDFITGSKSGGILLYSGKDKGLFNPLPKKLTSFNIYPNPSHHTFTINLPDYSDHKDYQLLIYNTTGQVVFKSTITKQNKTYNSHILPKGLYIVRIMYSKGEHFYPQKLIIQ